MCPCLGCTMKKTRSISFFPYIADLQFGRKLLKSSPSRRLLGGDSRAPPKPPNPRPSQERSATAAAAPAGNGGHGSAWQPAGGAKNGQPPAFPSTFAPPQLLFPIQDPKSSPSSRHHPGAGWSDLWHPWPDPVLLRRLKACSMLVAPTTPAGRAPRARLQRCSRPTCSGDLHDCIVHPHGCEPARAVSCRRIREFVDRRRDAARQGSSPGAHCCARACARAGLAAAPEQTTAVVHAAIGGLWPALHPRCSKASDGNLLASNLSTRPPRCSGMAFVGALCRG
jgi:hypothetical protein